MITNKRLCVAQPAALKGGGSGRGGEGVEGVEGVDPNPSTANGRNSLISNDGGTTATKIVQEAKVSE